MGVINRKIAALLEKLKAAVKNPEKVGTYAFLAVISALVYGVVFSYFTFLRHNTFYSAGWDLGNFNQAFYTTLSEGKMFYYTADLFFNPSGSMFAIHISPILFLVLPLYAISPSPVTLLVIKSFGVGLAAIPLYLLARELLKSSKAAFLVVLVYLLYSPLHGANWFDFQQSAFFALLLFLTYFLMTKKNWKLYFPTMLLTLMVEEHVAVVVAILAVFHFTINCSIKSLPKSLRRLKMDETWASVLTVVICIVYLFTAMSIKNSFPASPDFAHIYKASGNFRILGSGDTLTLPLYAALNPQRAFDALFYDFAYKFLYLAFLFSPLLFIPLRNRFCLGIIFLLMPFILSNYRPYYMLGIHYPFYVIPLIFVAAIYGVRRLEFNARMFTLKTMVVVVLLFTLGTSPLSPLSGVFVQQGVAHYSPIEFSSDEEKKSLNDLLNLLPANASILTQNLIFPHVSNRLNAYIIPFSEYERPSEMQEYVNHMLNNSEYVLIDLGSIDDMVRMVLNKISENNTYGPYALGKRAIMFKRGYHGEPINAYYVSDRTFIVHRELPYSSPPGYVISDPTSSDGRVLLYPKGVPGYCIYGPYLYLLQGAYEVTFTVKAGQHGSSLLGRCDITTELGANILSFRDTYGLELKTGEWTNITVPFSLSNITTRIEFRFFSRGAADLLFDRVLLKRISPSPTAARSMITLHIRDLKLRTGNLTEEKFLFHQHGAADRVFWYGPYWDFPPGNYSATFVMRVTPQPQEQGHHVLTLNITAKLSEATEPILLAERALYTQDFMVSNGSEWQSFKMEFKIEKPMIEVEFKGVLPTSDHDIFLAFIIVERLDLQ